MACVNREALPWEQKDAPKWGGMYGPMWMAGVKPMRDTHGHWEAVSPPYLLCEWISVCMFVFQEIVVYLSNSWLLPVEGAFTTLCAGYKTRAPLHVAKSVRSECANKSMALSCMRTGSWLISNHTSVPGWSLCCFISVTFALVQVAWRAVRTHLS